MAEPLSLAPIHGSPGSTTPSVSDATAMEALAMVPRGSHGS